MKYWKQVFWALRKPILGLIPFTVLLGFLIWLPNRDTAPLWKPMCCTVGARLLLIILLVVMISATLKKEEPLNEIMAKEGYSEAWLQKHSEIYPTPDRTQKLRRVDVLSYLGRYDDAKALLESIPTAGFNDDQKYEYQNARLDMLLTSGHYSEAIAELDRCRKFMDIYANTYRLRGAAYGCNAAVIRAIAGDYEDSEHFLKAAEHAILEQKTMSPVIVMIAKTMQLYALGFDTQAEEQAAKTRQEIETSPALAKDFQKTHMMQLLERAKNVAPENRQEVQA